MHLRLLVACVASCCVLSTSSLAFPELRLSPLADTVLVGDSINIDVEVSAVDDLYGAGFDLAFNPNRLRYIKATEGSFLNAGGSVPTIFVVTFDATEGTLLAGITRSNYQAGGASTGGPAVLMTLRFEVLAMDSASLNFTRSSLTAPDGITKYPHNAIGTWIFARTPTAVGNEEYDLSLPGHFLLGRPYPNPFNSSTTFSLSLQRRQQVRIDVVDVLGRRIREVCSRELTAGDHSFGWDGRNKNGEAVGTGVYFFFVRGETYSEVRKVVLVK